MHEKYVNQLVELVGSVTDNLGARYAVNHITFPDTDNKFDLYELSKCNESGDTKWTMPIMDMFKVHDLAISLDNDLIRVKGTATHLGVKNPYRVKFDDRYKLYGELESRMHEKIT